MVARERRARSSSGKEARRSSCVVYFTFLGHGPSGRELRWAWESAGGASARLGESAPETVLGDRTIVTAKATYGPVHGNWESDYDRRAKAASELMPSCIAAGVIPGSFNSGRAAGQ